MEKNLQMRDIVEADVMGDRVMSPEEFSIYIEKQSYLTEQSLIECILEHCDEKDLEYETVAKMLSPSLKEKIQYEAEQNNLMIRRASSLDLFGEANGAED
jgi:hypothetical protein